MNDLRATARAELEKRGIPIPPEPIASQNTAISQEHDLKAAAREELERRGVALSQNQEQKPEDAFSWPNFIMQQVGKGVMSLPDLLQSVAVSQSSPAVRSGHPRAHELGIPGHADISPEMRASALVPETEFATTPEQRIAGNIARTAGAAALPIGGMAGLGRSALTGAGIGAVSGGLQETGVPQLPADIAGIVASASVPGAIGRFRAPKSLLPHEENVAKYLQKMMGPEQIAQVSKNIKEAPAYPLTGYKPMTAEIANVPLTSQLHRLRYETTGSGLPEKAGKGREAIAEAMQPHTLKAAPAHEIKENVAAELKKREATRYAATHEGYTATEKMKQKIEVPHLTEFLKENPSVGAIGNDLRKIKRDITSNTVKKSGYEVIEEAGKTKIKKVQPTTESPAAQVRKLASIDMNLTDRIDVLRRSGRKKHATVLKMAQEELRKDLDKIEIYKKSRANYAELSKPVSEIIKHPTLKKLPKSRSNELMTNLFDKNSEDNIRSLKKVLGNDKEAWEGIQHATVKHLENSISNAGAEGTKQVLSYPEMKHFMKKHEGALKEVLSEDQFKLLGEVKDALHGQNIANTLGRGQGSPTAPRLSSEMGLKEGIGIKALEGVTHFLPTKMIRGSTSLMLNRYMQNKNANIMKVLDTALIDPEVAHKLLTHEFKDQQNFNKFLNNLRPVATQYYTRKEEEE